LINECVKEVGIEEKEHPHFLGSTYAGQQSARDSWNRGSLKKIQHISQHIRELSQGFTPLE